VKAWLSGVSTSLLFFFLLSSVTDRRYTKKAPAANQLWRRFRREGSVAYFSTVFGGSPTQATSIILLFMIIYITSFSYISLCCNINSHTSTSLSPTTTTGTSISHQDLVWTNLTQSVLLEKR
jgi:hypothetical protein